MSCDAVLWGTYVLNLEERRGCHRAMQAIEDTEELDGEADGKELVLTFSLLRSACDGSFVDDIERRTLCAD